MAFCATCGAAVEGQFCAKCGSRVGAAPSAAAGPGFQQSEALAENVAAALCYVLGLVTGILFLILTPYNKNPLIRFHAFQSIFLNVACIVASIVLNMVFVMLHMWTLLPLISLGIGRSDRAAFASAPSAGTSSRMMSLHSSMHSSQMKTEGPAISFFTSCWLLPQKEQ